LISKQLLIDTIFVISNEDDGDGGNDVMIEINNVRFTKGINLGNNTKGDLVTGERKIYVDKKYSTPYDFKVNDKIKFEGEDFTIFKIVEGRNYNSHHKELYVR